MQQRPGIWPRMPMVMASKVRIGSLGLGDLHSMAVRRGLPQAVKSVGVKGLFSGLQPALLGTAVSQGVYFYFYSLLRDLAVTRKHQAAGTKAGGSTRQVQTVCVQCNSVNTILVHSR